MTSDLVLLLAQWRTDGDGVIVAVRATDGGEERIGGMESATLAEEVCAAHNERLARLARGAKDLHVLPWRQGRHEPRHLYAQLGPEPSDDDPVVGTLDTPEAAEEACEAHNERLAAREDESAT